MSAKIASRAKSRSGARVPASSEALPPSREDHPDRSADGLNRNFGAPRVLIVDDNPGTLKLVSEMAARLGYHPTTAEDALDALFYLNKAHYDVVVTDFHMPFVDGYQLADQIKEKYLGTRVIIMTGNSETDVADIMDGSGIVDGLLFKPFNLKAMKEKIDLAINQGSGKWAF